MQPTTRQVLDYSSYSTLATRASSFDTRARLELDFHYSARLDTRLFGTRTIPTTEQDAFANVFVYNNHWEVALNERQNVPLSKGPIKLESAPFWYV